MADLGTWSRRLVKTALARTVRRVAGGSPASRLQPHIVGYHRVVEDFEAARRSAIPSLLISRAMFERHLDEIGRRFAFVDLDDIRDRLESGRPFARPVAAVTFDDGYRDVYEHAWPVLRRKGIPAAVFVVSGMIGRPGPLVHDQLFSGLNDLFAACRQPAAELHRVLARAGVDDPADVLRRSDVTPLGVTRTLLTTFPGAVTLRVIGAIGAAGYPRLRREPALPMTWDMLRRLRRAGVIVGSHTMTHAWLPCETPERVADEVSGSKACLERTLGEPVHYFAYPDGRFTADTVRAVARAGYRLACTTCYHRAPDHPRLTVPRQVLWERSSIGLDDRCSPEILECQLRGLLGGSRCAGSHA